MQHGKQEKLVGAQDLRTKALCHMMGLRDTVTGSGPGGENEGPQKGMELLVKQIIIISSPLESETVQEDILSQGLVLVS